MPVSRIIKKYNLDFTNYEYNKKGNNKKLSDLKKVITKNELIDFAIDNPRYWHLSVKRIIQLAEEEGIKVVKEVV